ncbi:hypothetical protein KJ365_13275 [Glaciecola sp. XM2]|uniref:hypothetical protein n=1 Tax=Glaciecola sp. XM2 TaxID=1914931 RepID=UPI001BDE4B59|nr:hypothetical protein [Glaciecola sp. XM2]MBT1451858.1 hypothetical protein [Glaciecola sp. XM2]
MQLHNFTKTALKIISGSFTALMMFALLAGQSAHATSAVIETKDIRQATIQVQHINRAVSLLMHLEQDLADAKAQLAIIDEGYQKGDFSSEEVFIAAVIYFDIENTLNDTRTQVAKNLTNMSDVDAKYATQALSQTQF